MEGRGEEGEGTKEESFILPEQLSPDIFMFLSIFVLFCSLQTWPIDASSVTSIHPNEEPGSVIKCDDNQVWTW